MEEIERAIPDMTETSKLKLLDDIICSLALQCISEQVQESSAGSRE